MSIFLNNANTFYDIFNDSQYLQNSKYKIIKSNFFLTCKTLTYMLYKHIQKTQNITSIRQCIEYGYGFAIKNILDSYMFYDEKDNSYHINSNFSVDCDRCVIEIYIHRFPKTFNSLLKHNNIGIRIKGIDRSTLNYMIHIHHDIPYPYISKLTGRKKAFYTALRIGNLEFIKYVIFTENTNIANIIKSGAWWAAIEGNNVNALYMLNEVIEDKELQCDPPEIVLVYAIESENIEIVKFFINNFTYKNDKVINKSLQSCISYLTSGYEFFDYGLNILKLLFDCIYENNGYNILKDKIHYFNSKLKKRSGYIDGEKLKSIEDVIDTMLSCIIRAIVFKKLNC